MPYAEDKDLHDEKVTDSRGDLWEHLNTAHESLKSAIQAYYSLSGGESFDVEYEGRSDIEKHLKETLRLTIITRALLPTTSSTTLVDSEFTETVRALMSGSHLTH